MRPEETSTAAGDGEPYRDPASANGGEVLLIGELAQRCGLSTQSIRFYEREGLLAPERNRTFRVYAEADVRRLEAILALRRMGLPITRIRDILGVLQKPAGTPRDRAVADLLSSHLDELKRRQAAIKDEIAATAEALDKLDLPPV